MIIIESALSFLGLGVPPPTPTWGGMLADGRSFLDTAWWISLFPGIVLMLTVLSVNVLGDLLRDVLDPPCEPVHLKPVVRFQGGCQRAIATSQMHDEPAAEFGCGEQFTGGLLLSGRNRGRGERRG